MVTTNVRRLRQLGVSEAQADARGRADRARACPATRAELAEHLAATTSRSRARRSSHLLARAAMQGRVALDADRALRPARPARAAPTATPRSTSSPAATAPATPARRATTSPTGPACPCATAASRRRARSTTARSRASAPRLRRAAARLAGPLAHGPGRARLPRPPGRRHPRRHARRRRRGRPGPPRRRITSLILKSKGD